MQENKIKKGRWTDIEHKKFMDAFEKDGKDWQKIQKKFKNRTARQIFHHAKRTFFYMSKEDINSFVLDKKNKKNTRKSRKIVEPNQERKQNNTLILMQNLLECDKQASIQPRASNSQQFRKLEEEDLSGEKYEDESRERSGNSEGLIFHQQCICLQGVQNKEFQRESRETGIRAGWRKGNSQRNDDLKRNQNIQISSATHFKTISDHFYSPVEDSQDYQKQGFSLKNMTLCVSATFLENERIQAGSECKRN